MNFIKKSQITKTYQNKKRPKEIKENLMNRRELLLKCCFSDLWFV